ncbi:hypothetical protein PVAP13_9KG061100 [Panicum virgatum]|uniref:RRM domain-containing protein n=1 Tax=Panicum virgatum TaxID=38727 RepID=A0A8T0NFH5_PANVG|nr:hypothetical protein PVAP13_9KG061100 [Panicum virgatum]
MAAADVEYRCFVGGLAWATDNASLQQAFASYGDVLDSKVITDRETGRSRGFGFVTFSTEQSMLDAIEAMNGKELDGRNITVNQAQSRGGGGGGGGYGGAAVTPVATGGTNGVALPCWQPSYPRYLLVFVLPFDPSYPRV